MNTLHIKRLTAGGVITNYHCVSRCGHCLYNSSPRRPRTYMDTDTAAAVFECIRSRGCRSVHIGGGEPMLDFERLLDVVEVACETGMAIAYVETNAAWFTDAPTAEARLTRLRDASVQTLLVSISPFHNAFIPWNRVNGVINACRHTGMAILPWSNSFTKDLLRMDPAACHAMGDFEAVHGPGYLKAIPGRYWIHMGGRALETFRPVSVCHPPERIIDQSPASCSRALSDTGHFHIDLYGSYIPGLCAGLAIPMEALGSPVSKSTYPLLALLWQGGIGALYRFAVNAYGFSPRSSGYMNHCDLCTDIRTALWQGERVAFPELAPDGFYQERIR